MTSRWRHAPDQRSRGATADAIACVRALGVVVPHEAIEGLLQRGARREVAAPEHHAPVLLENRALQAFDEAVGPGVARFGARVPEAELAAGRIKRPLELGAAIREDAMHRPPGAPIVRDDDLAQERGGGCRIMGGQQAGQPVRARRAPSLRRAACGRSARATGVAGCVPSAARPYAPPAARARSAGPAAWPSRPGAAAAARCWAPDGPARSAPGRPRSVGSPTWPH